MLFFEFVLFCKECISDNLPEFYSSYSPVLTTVITHSGSFHGLFYTNGHDKSSIVNLDFYYEEFCNHSPMNELILSMANTISSGHLVAA